MDMDERKFLPLGKQVCLLCLLSSGCCVESHAIQCSGYIVQISWPYLLVSQGSCSSRGNDRAINLYGNQISRHAAAKVFHCSCGKSKPVVNAPGFLFNQANFLFFSRPFCILLPFCKCLAEHWLFRHKDIIIISIGNQVPDYS